MLAINSLTNDASQQFTLTGIPGVQIGVLMRFMPRIQQWVMNISYGSFEADGIPILCSPNILRQWRNVIPFGLACTNVFFVDPYTLNDFADGSSSLFLLDSADVAAIEAALF